MIQNTLSKRTHILFLMLSISRKWNPNISIINHSAKRRLRTKTRRALKSKQYPFWKVWNKWTENIKRSITVRKTNGVSDRREFQNVQIKIPKFHSLYSIFPPSSSSSLSLLYLVWPLRSFTWSKSIQKLHYRSYFGPEIVGSSNAFLGYRYFIFFTDLKVLFQYFDYGIDVGFASILWVFQVICGLGLL